MARKSRKNRATEVESFPAVKFWRAALYVRLSVEFNSNRGDSLETQRQIMEAYLALCPDIEIMEVYTDNGVTGVSFQETCKTQGGPTFRYARIRENPGTRLNTRFFRGKPLAFWWKFCNLAKWDCKIFLPIFGPETAHAAPARQS